MQSDLILNVWLMKCIEKSEFKQVLNLERELGGDGGVKHYALHFKHAPDPTVTIRQQIKEYFYSFL